MKILIIIAISFTFCVAKNKSNTTDTNNRIINDSIKKNVKEQEDIALLKLKMFIGSQKI